MAPGAPGRDDPGPFDDATDVLDDLEALLGEAEKASSEKTAFEAVIVRDSLPPPAGADFETGEMSETIGGDEPAPGAEEAVSAELIAAAPRALRLLARELRLGKGAANQGVASLGSGITELFIELSPILERHGELHVRVRVDGLYVGGERVLEVVPQDDRALFRLFQHGVRQFSFSEGVTPTELESFVKVVTTDPETLDHVEEDVSTLLVDQELENIHFVVVDTFMEGMSGSGGAADSRRAADLAELVASSLRERLSERPDLMGDGGGTVRFMAADVTFLEQADLGALLTALQPQRGDESEAGAHLDADLEAFGRDLEGALERWTPWLPAAVLRALDGAVEDEVDALCRLLAGQLWADAQHAGLGAVERQLEEIGRWLDAAATEAGDLAATAETLTRALFSTRLSRMALSALKSGDPDDELAAVGVFRRLTPEERGKALVDVCALQPSPARAGAIVALLRRPLPPIEPILENLVGYDARAAKSVLGAIAAGGEGDERTLAAFQVALTHPDPSVRSEALGWTVDHGGDRAASVLSDALRDPSPIVRGAALFLLVDKRPSYGPALLKTWFGSPAYKKLPMEEKRLGAFALAAAAGQAVLPLLRKHLHKLNITGDTSLDETRAAAVAALGVLGDTESEGRITKLSKSRFCGPALQEEAKLVAAALSRGRTPYGDPFRELRKIALQVGLAEEAPPDRSERSTLMSQQSAADGPDVESPAGAEPTAAMQATLTLQAFPPPAESLIAAARGTPATQIPPPPEPARGDDAALEPGADLIDELLQSFSFDDLPSTVPLSGSRGGSGGGGERR